MRLEPSLEFARFDISQKLVLWQSHDGRKCEMCEAVPSVSIPKIVDRKPDNTSRSVPVIVEDDVHTPESVERRRHD